MLCAAAALLLLPLLSPAPNPDALAKEYFQADAARRAQILQELAPVDTLTAAQVKVWRKKLAHLARKGKRLQTRGTHYFYDEKEKKGKYIVEGSRGGNVGLLVGLHGGGEGEGDAGGAAGTFGGIAQRFHCVGIFPEVLKKTERGWTTSGTEEFVLELIEAAKRTWRVDRNRVYLVGHSMGGYGSWTIGAHHADLFAGLGPYAGAPTPYTADGSAYGKVVGIEDGVLYNVRDVALHIYQSLDDPKVPPAPNLFAVKRLKELQKEYGGFPFVFEKVNGRGHGAPPDGHVAGFKWLYEHTRDTHPKRILWQPVLSYVHQFYWLYWDRPTPKVVVDVRIDKPNEITVDLGGGTPGGFHLLLDDKLVDLSKEVVVKMGDQVVFKGKVPYTLSTMLLTGIRNDPDLLFPARIDLKG